MTFPPPPPPTSAPPPPPPPQYYPAYVAAPQPVGKLSKALTVLIVVAVGLTVLGTPVNIAVARRARAYLDGTDRADAFTSATNAQSAIGGLAGMATIAIAVLTIIWMWRMASNHRALGRVDATWAPGWAIGGWFCPPVLYVIPFLMFRELWRASDPTVPPHTPGWKSAPVGLLPTLWFVAYGILPIIPTTLTVSRFFRNFGLGLGDPDELAAKLAEAPAWQPILTSVITVIAAGVYLVLTRELTQRHRRLIGEE